MCAVIQITSQLPTGGWPFLRREKFVKANFLVLAMIAVLVPVAKSQTTLTIPSANIPCSPTPVYCYSVPLSDGSSVWIDIAPYNNPISSRFLTFHSGTWAGTAYINLDSTYVYTTEQITLNGHVYTVPTGMSFTFSGTTTSGLNYTGSGAITLGNWYVAGGRYGGLRYYLTGGSLNINDGEAASVKSLVLSGPVSGPQPEWGGYILVCGWNGVFPPYFPTGHIGSNGIQVYAQCAYYDEETGTYGTYTNYYWWIPWTTWFFPPAQTPYCESSNFETSACTQYANVPAIKASTPANPSQ